MPLRHVSRSRFLLAVPLAASLLAAAPPTPEAPPGDGRGDFMRGMVVSCPRGGQIWGSPLMAEALRQIRALGADWVAIHPYAGVRRDGSMRLRPTTEAPWLEQADQLIRSERFRLFWKPHLAYWGSFEWRGAIAFDDEAAWGRFFDGYRSFILDQARFAERVGAEIFAVGVELEGTVHRPEWPALIEAVREVYSGRLTYAANWDRLDDVPFWSRLDMIGVHAYFPLSAIDEPTTAELEAAWSEVFERLRRVSDTAGGLPLFFAEIGYNRSATAASEPWAYPMSDSPDIRVTRQRLIRVAARSAEAEPRVEGMFWWKWIPGPNQHDRDFSMKDPEALEALQDVWGAGSRRTTAD